MQIFASSKLKVNKNKEYFRFDYRYGIRCHVAISVIVNTSILGPHSLVSSSIYLYNRPHISTVVTELNPS
jgi:hypothetical protein